MGNWPQPPYFGRNSCSRCPPVAPSSVEGDERIAAVVQQCHRAVAGAAAGPFSSIAASGCQVPLRVEEAPADKIASPIPATYTASTAPVASLATRGCDALVFSGTGVAHARHRCRSACSSLRPSKQQGRSVASRAMTTIALPLASTARVEVVDVGAARLDVDRAAPRGRGGDIAVGPEVVARAVVGRPDRETIAVGAARHAQADGIAARAAVDRLRRANDQRLWYRSGG